MKAGGDHHECPHAMSLLATFPVQENSKYNICDL